LASSASHRIWFFVHWPKVQSIRCQQNESDPVTNNIHLIGSPASVRRSSPSISATKKPLLAMVKW